MSVDRERERDYAEMEKEWPVSAGVSCRISMFDEKIICADLHIQKFDTTIEQRDPVDLRVQGIIPAYAAGTLYRTGPGGYKVQTASGKTWAASHWFDGLTQIHRFKISAPQKGNESCTVRYNSRRTVDKLTENIKKQGGVKAITFGQKRDPCDSYFKKAMSVFYAAASSVGTKRNIDPSSMNVGVTMTANMPGLPPQLNPPDQLRVSGHTDEVKSLHSKTDATVYQHIDPETLEPVGFSLQSQQHPDLKGQLSCAHAKCDPVTGDLFNYNLQLGPSPQYRVFRMSAATGETDILATISAPAAYVHSIFITADHVILCIWNSHLLKNGLDVVLKQNILEAIAPFDKSQPAKWYVIDRKYSKGLLAVYESSAFYAFHTVNAWAETSPEDPSKSDIVAELITYENTDVLKRLYYENLLGLSPSHEQYYGDKGSSTRQEMHRYRLSDIPSECRSEVKRATIEYNVPKDAAPELPTINPRYLTQPHRYTYGGADRSSYAVLYDALVKWDSETRSAVYWAEHGHTPGEPVFVVDPEGTDEDDGVLLSVVLDGFSERSYLLCLSAKDLKEVGRAEMDITVGFGFHGCHVSAVGMSSSAD